MQFKEMKQLYSKLVMIIISLIVLNLFIVSLLVMKWLKLKQLKLNISLFLKKLLCSKDTSDTFWKNVHETFLLSCVLDLRVVFDCKCKIYCSFERFVITTDATIKACWKIFPVKCVAVILVPYFLHCSYILHHIALVRNWTKSEINFLVILHHCTFAG